MTVRRPCPKSMRVSHGEVQRGGASLLPSSLSSATVPPVASPVVPAGESTNINCTNAEMASLGMIAGSGRGDVVDIVGVSALRAKSSAILIPTLLMGSAQCYNCHTTATPLEER